MSKIELLCPECGSGETDLRAVTSRMPASGALYYGTCKQCGHSGDLVECDTTDETIERDVQKFIKGAA